MEGIYPDANGTDFYDMAKNHQNYGNALYDIIFLSRIGLLLTTPFPMRSGVFVLCVPQSTKGVPLLSFYFYVSGKDFFDWLDLIGHHCKRETKQNSQQEP